MEEKVKSTWGGKRAGAGRKPSDKSKKQIALKLDRDLYNVFYSEDFKENKGRYINDAVREKMKNDGLI